MLVFSLLSLPATDGFDWPVGAPDAQGYFDAQPFGENHHLGQDWNGNRGGDSDLGDPVHSVANGLVVYAEDVGGGWGNVVIVAHRVDAEMVTSLYGHLDRISVELGAEVDRGDLVGTIGDAHGVYIPHLHFELRDDPTLGVGPGYAADTTGYVDPGVFIPAHRPGDEDAAAVGYSQDHAPPRVHGAGPLP